MLICLRKKFRAVSQKKESRAFVLTFRQHHSMKMFLFKTFNPDSGTCLVSGNRCSLWDQVHCKLMLTGDSEKRDEAWFESPRIFQSIKCQMQSVYQMREAADRVWGRRPRRAVFSTSDSDPSRSALLGGEGGSLSWHKSVSNTFSSLMLLVTKPGYFLGKIRGEHWEQIMKLSFLWGNAPTRPASNGNASIFPDKQAGREPALTYDQKAAALIHARGGTPQACDVWKIGNQESIGPYLLHERYIACVDFKPNYSR